MRLTVDSRRMSAWIDNAQLGDTTWFKPRKELWSSFVTLARRGSDPTFAVVLTHDDFVSLKSFLLSRNPDLTDDKRLAFEKTLLNISDTIDQVLFAVQHGVDIPDEFHSGSYSRSAEFKNGDASDPFTRAEKLHTDVVKAHQDTVAALAKYQAQEEDVKSAPAAKPADDGEKRKAEAPSGPATGKGMED